MPKGGLGKMQKILAIPGSLRADSSSNELLKIISQSIPKGVDFEIYSGVGSLPHFNGVEENPETVTDFQKRVSEAAGVLICTPEYAFGVPGSLKNALDWTVSSGEFMNKPVALITASSQGEKGHESLQQTLAAISAKLHPSTTLLISFIRTKVKDGKIVDEKTKGLVASVIREFINRIKNEN